MFELAKAKVCEQLQIDIKRIYSATIVTGVTQTKLTNRTE